MMTLPERVSDAGDAFDLVRSTGAAILTSTNVSGEYARETVASILEGLAPIIPEPAPVQEGVSKANRYWHLMPGVDEHRAPFQSGHTDGFAYGDAYPDYVFLLCRRAAARGGESFVVDTYALLDALEASDDQADRELVAFLTTVPVEQTEPGFHSSVAPVFIDNGRGRRMARWTPVQRADDALTGEEHEAQAMMLGRWRTMAFNASMSAPRFTLQPGEMLCLDNYRMLHGRTGFDDTERALWRVWAWTTEALRIPDGMLHSDNRYARTN
jgi:alpha-ketoglutarate-dependent taurine dioxygenase